MTSVDSLEPSFTIMAIIIAGLGGVLGTLRTKRFWTKIAVSAGVLTALAACAPR
jgi:hypothetical protein